MMKEDETDDLVLVSTQSVEAGVDIDCNVGFRDYAPLDSIDQIGGRVNRNNKREQSESKLYIFDWGTSTHVYDDDARIIVQNLRKKEIKEILQERKFSKFYDRVIRYLQDKEQELSTIYNRLKNPTLNLKFEDLAKQEYIEDNITFFLPLKLPLSRCRLSKETQKYLKNYGVKFPDELDGEDIWRLFKEAHAGKLGNKWLESKKLQSLVNKFTISVTDRWIEENQLSNLVKDLIGSGKFEAKGGIVKLDTDDLKELSYSFEEGLNPEKLTELVMNQF